MNTLTPLQQGKIWGVIKDMNISKGRGTEESACTIAAINMGLGNGVVDTIPECMSPVIGRWIIKIQDAMPHEMRNSKAWKRLAPKAAGTGRKFEKERVAIILDHMWTVTLPLVLPIAEMNGFGAEWRKMLDEKTDKAAMAACKASGEPMTAMGQAAAAAMTDEWGDLDQPAEMMAVDAADWVVCAAGDDAWETINPIALLEKLIAVSKGRSK